VAIISTYGALQKSSELAEVVISEQSLAALRDVLAGGKNSDGKYDLTKLWALDASLGGIGGYCLPAEPAYNPFPGGHARRLYRPLQYARTNMQLLDLDYTSRYVIQNVGMHLEAAAKLMLAEQVFLGKLKNKPLGAAAESLCRRGLLAEACCEGLRLLIPLVNHSKHEVNQDEERDGSFVPADALIVYIAGRILGLEMLSQLNRTDIPMVPTERLLMFAEALSPR